MKTTAELRSEFLDYFSSKGHEIVRSSSLVPAGDKTLLFTNAGMVQFKDLFTGVEKRDYVRATTSQRCVRAGGKHNDLDNVGYTARHHTFFEMLGNFSFGDYFKHDAIRYAWEFLTDRLGLPADKLWVTVFEEDDEAHDIWVNDIGVPADRVIRIGAKDNFWMMGDTGPCGPCSEIFYDHGPDVAGGPPGSPDEDGDRYIEIWNLVFMQFERSADGSMTPLPMPSVDTGMGLERIAAVLQHVHSNYEIDLFQNLLSATQSVLNTPDTSSASLRVIADHIRSCAFLIADGVLPANEGRGYVLRRIIRRAARHGHKLGATDPFFHRLVKPLIKEMGDAYPELVQAQSGIEAELLREEERFNVTLASGMKILEEDFSQITDGVVPGHVVFKLYDTYGFPVDLTADIARERELTIDKPGFDTAMAAQKARARAASNFSGTGQLKLSNDITTRFDGYSQTEGRGQVVALFANGEPATAVSSGEAAVVVLDATPFYGESGGQVGDTGHIKTAQGEFEVVDTRKQGNAILHFGTVTNGRVATNDAGRAHIDAARRHAIALNHSATHLLHGGLRHVLGSHVQQKGSLVNHEHLRFDFSHHQSVTSHELAAVERWVNDQIRLNGPATTQEMTLDDALEAGAMALFSEKYAERVRVVSIGDESIELCGGTHVSAAGDIGAFRIRHETSIGSGVRRIEAVSGAEALDMTRAEHDQLVQVADRLKTTTGDVVSKVDALLDNNRQLNRQLEQLKAKLAVNASAELVEDATKIGEVSVVVHKVADVDVKALRTLMDDLRQKLNNAAVVLVSVNGSKAIILAGVTKPLFEKIKAGELVNVVARPMGGKGGGRPDLAQAGADNIAQVDAALAAVEPWLREKLG